MCNRSVTITLSVDVHCEALANTVEGYIFTLRIILTDFIRFRVKGLQLDLGLGFGLRLQSGLVFGNYHNPS